jgi:hypothetical protein
MITTVFIIAIAGTASFLFPCTTPFVALAATLVTHGGARRALLGVGAAWAIDESAGFLFFGYPHTTESYGLAAAALASAAAAVAAAAIVRRRRSSAWLGFVVAALAFECVFAIATLALGETLAMFAPAIDAWVIGANAIFFAVFELARRFAPAETTA